MTIKELEQRTGLPRTSIRFYEQEELLHPERRENNYRDYSEEDARTLKKIKLLRQLSLDLDAIRRLQAGELSLSQALAGQARALEGDRADLERYAQVCQELSRTETSYGELDPEPWLAALEEKSLPLSRRVDPTEQDSIAAAPYPWRRFFARALDWALAAILWTAFRLLALRWDWAGWGADALYGYADAASLWLGGWLVLLLLEPILLCTWGYTPGKWLLRLRVRRGDGDKLTWRRAQLRTLLVWLRGTGLGIPLLNLLCLAAGFAACRRDQVLPWDRGLEYTARPAGAARTGVFVLAVLLLWAVRPLDRIDDWSYRIPHPSGPLTPAQVAENYNFLEQRMPQPWSGVFGERPIPVLNEDGSWAVPPPVYLEQWHWVDLEDSEWGPVEFTTDEAGYVTGLSVTWSPKGNPHQETLDLWFSMTEFLPHLFSAISPGGADWSAPWRDCANHRDGFDLVRALDQVNFAQAGSSLSVPGRQTEGVTAQVEVLSSTGYQLTGENGRLLQETPGAGVLTLRFTAFLDH